MCKDDTFEQTRYKLQSKKRLPTDREFQVADEDGFTIAHWWVQIALMEYDFGYWGLADNKGWTVAHSAAAVKNLPDAFSRWDLVDDNGDTVAHVAVRSGKFPIHKFTTKTMMTRNKNGISVWDEVKKHDQAYINSARRILGVN